MGQIDVLALRATLDVRRAALGLSWRDVGRQTGLSPSVFSRMRAGHRPDVEGFATCCQWLNMPMDAFNGGRQHAGNLEAELLLLLRRHGVPEIYWSALGGLIGKLARPSTG